MSRCRDDVGCWHFLAVLASEHVRQLSEHYLPFVGGRRPVDRDPERTPYKDWPKPPAELPSFLDAAAGKGATMPVNTTLSAPPLGRKLRDGNRHPDLGRVLDSRSPAHQYNALVSA